MRAQWKAVNNEEKAMVRRGAQAIALARKKAAHMFTGETIFTANITANVEKLLATSGRSMHRREYVLAAIGYVQVLFGSTGKPRGGTWGQSVIFVSTTSHESNQTPNHFNNRFYKIIGRQTW
jgi:hypothetical protein